MLRGRDPYRRHTLSVLDRQHVPGRSVAE
jgi:hypothetical protein